MIRLNKQEFWEWAYDDLLTNTTRGVLAEYIVATAPRSEEPPPQHYYSAEYGDRRVQGVPRPSGLISLIQNVPT